MPAQGSSPLISIVIPTRDRPEFAALALEAIRRQSFQDFEVIVSDNALHRRFEPDPRLFDGVRIRYVRPPKSVWMTDHWEFAVGQARGRYVGVLGDRNLLAPTALEHVAVEIRRDSPEVVSWQFGVFQPSGSDLAGPGIVTIRWAPRSQNIKISAAEALDYLLAIYLDPNKPRDHQLEIRGSIYHGVFSATLLAAIRSRYGRIFRFYAPDVNAQCVAMQIAREITCIQRPMELRIAGPSNGVDVATRVSHLLATQREAASGASGTSPRLIPDVSTSISHLLACDLVALTGRPLRLDQWIELHARMTFDLHRISGWPDGSFKRSQLLAVRDSAARFAPEVRRQLSKEKWKARQARVRALFVERLRSRFGTHLDGFQEILRREEAYVDKRRFESLFAALDATT